MSEYKTKTTIVMETVVSILADLPEDYWVFVTSPHVSWLRTLGDEFKESGLVGVMFFTPNQIIDGVLRGRKGVLLIDDLRDLSKKELEILNEEEKILKNYLPKEVLNKIYGENN